MANNKIYYYCLEILRDHNVEDEIFYSKTALKLLWTTCLRNLVKHNRKLGTKNKERVFSNVTRTNIGIVKIINLF